MKEKILLVIHTPPPYGGGEIQAYHLKNQFSRNSNYIIYDYSRQHLTRFLQGRFSFDNLTFGVKWILKVLYLIIKEKPAKIYFTLPKGFYAFLRNGFIILIAHSLKIKILGELPGVNFIFLEKKGTLKYKIGLFLLRKVDEIRFLSETISNEHEKYMLKKHIVIDNGVEIPQGVHVKELEFNRPSLQLIYVGTLEYSKGIQNIIEAVKICSAEKLQIHFNLLGGWVLESEKKSVLKTIEEFQLQELITFHGIKTNDAKWNILKMNAILVHPTYWDGVPLSILEAMGIGLAVISTYVGGIPDTVKNNHNGILLGENTPENLFYAIKYLNNNRQILKSISENNKTDFQNRFDLHIFLNNMNNWFLS